MARRLELDGGWVLVAGDDSDGVPPLTEVHWAITGRCNLACRHCFMEAPTGRYRDVSREDAFRLIDQFARAGVVSVSLTGGEPVVRADLFEILEELAVRDIRVSEIATNGVLVTDAVLGQVARTGHQPRWKVSFDGCGAHDAMRGVPGTEAIVVDAIGRLAASGVPLAVVTTADALNLEVLESTYALMAELRVPIWMVGRTQSTGNCRNQTRAVSTARMAECCLSILRRWNADGRPIGIVLDQFFAGGPRSPLGRQWNDVPRERTPFAADSYECGACRWKAFLLPDGTLLPCTGFAGTAVADSSPNLLERDLSDAWTHSALRDFADMKKRAVLASQPECGACEHFPRCGAGCRAFALTEAGDLMAKDPRACALWKQGYRRQFEDAAGAAGREQMP